MSAADELDRELDASRRRKRSKKKNGPTASSIRRAGHAGFELVSSGESKLLTANHFLGIYVLLHEKVYGVDPSEELAGREGLAARSSSASMLRRSFGGDPDKMLAFVRWTWARERSRERWRRENGVDGRRIGWRAQFSANLLNDYRIYLRRRGGR